VIKETYLVVDSLCRIEPAKLVVLATYGNSEIRFPAGYKVKIEKDTLPKIAKEYECTMTI
jgi:hypothetical protein